MPTNVVSIDKMQVGKKGGGKHWTRAEVERRRKAAESLQPKDSTRLSCPKWLDSEARKVWHKTLANLRGYQVLEKPDEDMLATYCDAVARYKEATEKVRQEGYVATDAKMPTVNPYVKAAQSYARIMMTYAERLGLTAAARARLAKKIADGKEKQDANADLFA